MSTRYPRSRKHSNANRHNVNHGKYVSIADSRANSDKDIFECEVYNYKKLTTTDLKAAGKSFHANCRSRAKRMAKVNELDGKPVVYMAFLVNRGHSDGQEVHVITEEGIIYIYNNMKLAFNEMNALVTVLIARREQVLRYFLALGLTAKEDILEKCDNHTAMGYNYL